MAVEYSTARVGDLADTISETHKMQKEHLIFLNTSDILHGKFLHRTYTAVENWPGQAKKSIHKDDILFSEIRPANGRWAYIDEEADDFVVSTKLMVIRAKKDRLLPRFLYQFLTSPNVTSYLQHLAESRSGTFPQITFDQIASLEIPLPSLSEQKVIAHVIETLDDKIELNRRMNATLEAMARALFQSWFVDFDPIRAKLDGRKPTGLDADTAALFPAHFQDSPLGHIPQGWTAGRIGDIATNSRRGVQPNCIAVDTPYIALEHMPRRCIALADWGNSADVMSGKSVFRKGEILFGKLRPYFHKVGVAPVDGVCSTDILILSPKNPEWFGFLLGHASSDALVQFVDLASTGTKMPRTNWGDISSFKVALPPESVAAAFTRVIKPMIERMIANLHQSLTLAAPRDTMLPKLIAGELRVKANQPYIVQATS